VPEEKKGERMKKNYYYCDMPCGRIGIAENGQGITHVLFRGQPPPRGYEENESALIRRAASRLFAWFRGERQDFDLPLAPGGTDFQHAVWRAVMAIPYGETRSYREIAARLGNVKASRAVGRANGLNPIPFMIPCHRVIGSNGALTGYAGGLALKKQLLDLERKKHGD